MLPPWLNHGPDAYSLARPARTWCARRPAALDQIDQDPRRSYQVSLTTGGPMAHFVTLHDGERRKPATAMRICRTAADFDPPPSRLCSAARKCEFGARHTRLPVVGQAGPDRRSRQPGLRQRSVDLEIIMKRRLKNSTSTAPPSPRSVPTASMNWRSCQSTRRMPAPLPGGTATRSTGCWWRRRGTRPAPREPSM